MTAQFPANYRPVSFILFIFRTPYVPILVSGLRGPNLVLVRVVLLPGSYLTLRADSEFALPHFPTLQKGRRGGSNAHQSSTAVSLHPSLHARTACLFQTAPSAHTRPYSRGFTHFQHKRTRRTPNARCLPRVAMCWFRFLWQSIPMMET